MRKLFTDIDRFYIASLAPVYGDGYAANIIKQKTGRSYTVKQLKDWRNGNGIKIINRTGRRNTIFDEVQQDLIAFFTSSTTDKVIAKMLRDYTGGSFTTDQIRGWRTRNHLPSGRTGHFGSVENPRLQEYNFKKGHHYNRATEFKPGDMPINTLDIGTERVISGYIYVKIDNKPKAGLYENWKRKQELNWEAANGPLPEGMILKCLDGNTYNCNADNWVPIRRKQLAKINKLSKTNNVELNRAIVKYTELQARISDMEAQDEKGKREQDN